MLKSISVFLIKKYQKYFSKGTCAFTPTCSEYTLEAILRFGFFRGVFLGIKRILRCNPWSKGGFDRVPDKKSDKKWLV